MAAHMVVLLDPVDESPGKEVLAKLQEHYEDSFPLLDGIVYILRGTDVAEQIIRKLGLAGDKGEGSSGDALPAGLVVKLNRSWAGYAPTSLWDWLDEATK